MVSKWCSSKPYIFLVGFCCEIRLCYVLDWFGDVHSKSKCDEATDACSQQISRDNESKSPSFAKTEITLIHVVGFKRVVIDRKLTQMMWVLGVFIFPD